MTCQDFEEIIIELARDQIIGANEREAIVSHATNCPRCSGRLADERALTAGLKRLVLIASKEQAPARVELSLIEAFRAGAARSGTRAAVTSRFAGSTRRWGAVAAAVVLLALMAVALLRLQGTSKLTSAPDTTSARDDKVRNEPAPPGAQQPNALREDQQGSRVQKPKRRNRRLQNYLAASGAPVRPQHTSQQTEVFTDFIPLFYSNDLRGTESGQVMRIEMPRSALASFGLPMNIERAGQRIKADLVVGDDGIARAIRFVR